MLINDENIKEQKFIIGSLKKENLENISIKSKEINNFK